MSHDAAPTPARTGSIEVKGRTLPLAQVLGAEAKRAENWARNGFFLFTGLICPILAMIVFTIFSGVQMWALGLLAAAAPFIGMALSLVWKKPWGVIVETPASYQTIWQTTSKDEAEQVAAQIRAALV